MSGEMVKAPARSDDSEGGLDIRIPEALDPTRGRGKFWVSTVPETPEAKAALVNIIGGQLPKLDTLINTTVLVMDVGRQLVEVTNKDTGEVYKAVRSILFMAGGQAVATVSEGVSQSLGLIFAVFSPPPWRPALPIKVLQLAIGEGRRFYQLQVDVDALKGQRGNKAR